MISNDKIWQNICELKSLNEKRDSKYLRNYRAYWYTPWASLKNIRDPSLVGYFQKDDSWEDDTTATPQINVIKSVIDTLTSKIAQSKVRPFFNTMNGSFKDIQVTKQAQQFFDLYFDEQNTNKVVSNAFRDACIFDTGVIYIDPISKKISRALPNQVYVRPSEAHYKKFTRAYYEEKDYPVTLLDVPYKGDKEYVTFGVYYDAYNKVFAKLIDNEIVKTEKYEADVIPFVFLHFSDPIIGRSSTSIVDMLDTIQKEIDILMCKIKDASQLTPANAIFVPKGSNVAASAISNRSGLVYEYVLPPGVSGSPVTVATPQFISEQYMNVVEKLVEQAYNMVGISQLSSQSQKPTGLDSGIALSTMENIESDRFETQLNQVIRAYVEVAKTCLKVFPPDEDILPEDSQRLAVKWSDIVKETNKMTIQFSAADSLSKDPSVKLAQLQQLAMAGIIPQSRIAQFMELPDIQGGFSLSNNAINAVLTVISECIEKNNMVVPDYIPFQMLKEEIINTQLSLKAAGADKNKKDIDKLSELYAIVEDKEQYWQNEMTNQQTQINNQTAQTLDGQQLPSGQNVLTQEANMTPTQPTGNQALGTQPQLGPSDMDLTSRDPTRDNRDVTWKP